MYSTTFTKINNTVLLSQPLVKKVFIIIFLLGGFCGKLFSQIPIEESKKLFKDAFEEYLEMLEGEKEISLKRAVFLFENAFSDDTLNYEEFCKTISNIVYKLEYNIVLNNLEKYKTVGNWAAYTYLKEPSPLNNNQHYEYDFEDFSGQKDFSNMFVTKLLRTKKGNCSSLPLLYKILCDELGTESYLAIAPRHLYIKHQDENGHWVNVELTNGGFPRDQWIIQQLGISVEAIKSEIYMSPLSDKENIILCIHYLANAYKHKYSYDNFVYQLVNKGLSYSPNNILLLTMKADCLLHSGLEAEKDSNRDHKQYQANYHLYKECVSHINSLGYSEISPEDYDELMKKIESEK